MAEYLDKTGLTYLWSKIKAKLDAKADKTTADALGKRIDNLILSSGSESSAEVIDARTGYDGKAYNTLGTAIRTQVNNLKEDLKHLLNYDTHSEIKFEQGSINSNGEWIESSTRVRTKAPVSAKIGDYITIKDSKYIFRLFYNYNDTIAAGDWTTTFKFSVNKDKVWLLVAKANSSEITPSEAESIVFDTNIEGYIITERKIITDTTLTKEGQVADAKATGDMIGEIRNSVKINHYNLNNVYCGAENQIWSWWYYPQVVSFNRVRNKIYWGYTTSDGYTGIAEYDLDTETTKKNNLKISDIDDHNGLAIYVYNDGTIICAYSGGHNTDKQMHIRVSTAKECIEHFDNEIALDSTGYTSYGQFIYYSGKLFLFYRINNMLWAYRYTEDKGTSWSEEVVLIKASVQYYCKFVPTTTDGVIRVCMYSNPGADDNAIRQAFFHLDTLTLYDSDNSTMLGKSNVVNTNVTILIDIENAFSTQRLFDVAITNINRPLILYAPFNINSYNDSVYKVYDNGNVITICNGGEALWHPKYQGGASWIDADKIVSIRGSNGYDVVELYDYSNGAVTLNSTLYSEMKGNIPIRNARPIVDINKKALLWHRGYYNVTDYTDFNSDAKLYTIIDEKIRN